jgi:hypothetical protein
MKDWLPDSSVLHKADPSSNHIPQHPASNFEPQYQHIQQQLHTPQLDGEQAQPQHRRWKSGMEATGAVPDSKYYRDRPLFGGAITADIPREFIDARWACHGPEMEED